VSESNSSHKPSNIIKFCFVEGGLEAAGGGQALGVSKDCHAAGGIDTQSFLLGFFREV